jgi:hypothetical protein
MLSQEESMKKLTTDEVVRQWPEKTAPANTFAGAAEGGAGAFSTFPASQPTGEDVFPFPPGKDEVAYVPPPSNLPLTVSAAESKRHNCNWQAQTPWDSETEKNAPILAGTRAATPNTTPVADFSGWKVGESLAEGSISGIVEGLTDSFDALRKRGGGGA